MQSLAEDGSKALIAKYLPVHILRPGKYQPRKHFDAENLAELAESIKDQGILQPLIVRPIANNIYEIIAGERRWRASQLVGIHVVPCIIKICGDEKAAEIALAENEFRVDLSIIEKASATQKLIEEFDYTHDQAAKAVGISRAAITNLLRLLELDKDIQIFLQENKLTEAHGKILAGIKNAAMQRKLALQAIKFRWSSRQLENAVKSLSSSQKRNAHKDPNIRDLESKLSNYLNNPVSLEYKKDQSGHIVISFHSLNHLQGVFEKIGFKEENKF